RSRIFGGISSALDAAAGVRGPGPSAQASADAFRLGPPLPWQRRPDRRPYRPPAAICSSNLRLRILAPTPRSADRRDLQAPLNSSLEKGVARELGIRLDQALGFVPHFVQQVGLLERSHRIVCEAVLSRSHQLARATQPHVFFGQLEPVVLPLQQAEPRERLVARFLGPQHAWGLRAAPPAPPPD